MIIGTCSCCGGAVSVPDVWGGINPPTPTCTQCGAMAAMNGMVIPMREPKRTKIDWTEVSRKAIDSAPSDSEREG